MWLGWSSRVLLPEANTDDSLSNVSLPSGSRIRAARSVRRTGWLASDSLADLADATAPLGDGHQAGQGPADEETPAEHLAHIPLLMQVLADEAVMTAWS